MDPITHALFGTSAIRTCTSNKRFARVGLISSVFPDIDVILHLFLGGFVPIYLHRHFTHSLIFACFASFAIAIIASRHTNSKRSFLQMHLAAFAGYLSHLLLDLFTAYGTAIAWPFSVSRMQYGFVNVVDPIPTLILAVALTIDYLRENTLFTKIGMVLFACYIGFGALQQHRTTKVVHQIAKTRNHEIESLIVHPSLGNTLLWKAVYTAQGRIYTVAIRSSISGNIKIYGGQSAKLASIHSIKQNIKSAKQLRELEMLNTFAHAFIGQKQLDGKLYVADLRYSMLPNKITPLWELELDPEDPKGKTSFRRKFYDTNRSVTREFWRMIKGK